MNVATLASVLPPPDRKRGKRTVTPEIISAFQDVRHIGSRVLSRELGYSKGYIESWRNTIATHCDVAYVNPNPTEPKPVRITREPMRAGHPVSMNAIWSGLERWRVAV